MEEAAKEGILRGDLYRFFTELFNHSPCRLDSQFMGNVLHYFKLQ